MFGSGFRIALGPLKFLFRDSKWPRSCEITHRFADYYVDKALQWRQERMHLEKMQSTGGELKDHRQQHILLHGMAEQTEDRTELRNQILQALMAARETTSVLISNVFFLLSRRPIVWQRLRREVLLLEDHQITLDTLQNMKYLRNVLNESESLEQYRLVEKRLIWNGPLALCLYLVFPQMNRVSLIDTTLPVGGGPDGNSPIYVPKGTMFDTSYHVLHRLHSIWGPSAEVFDPDRWDTFRPGAWEFLPFGPGPRGYVYCAFIILKSQAVLSCNLALIAKTLLFLSSLCEACLTNLVLSSKGDAKSKNYTVVPGIRKLLQKPRTWY